MGAELLAFGTQKAAARRGQERWGRDEALPLLMKAAAIPASLTGSGRADTLANSAVSNFLLGIGPTSAGSVLLSRGLQLSLAAMPAFRARNLAQEHRRRP